MISRDDSIFFVHTRDQFGYMIGLFVVAIDPSEAIKRVCKYLSWGGWVQTGIAGGVYKVIKMKIKMPRESTPHYIHNHKIYFVV